jgi:hypothetical protein
MNKWRWGLVGGIAAVSLAGTVAWGAPVGADPAQVQALTNELESSLSKVGCGASASDDVNLIQSVIAKSGVQPEAAREALKLLRVWPKLCGDQALAALTVEQSVTVALEDSQEPSAGMISGPPIGPPVPLLNQNGGPRGNTEYVSP